MAVNSNHLVSLLLCAALGAAAAGCSTLDSLGWGKGAGAPTKESGTTAIGGVYYTGAADLPLYRSPGGEIVTRLPQHTKLYRDDLQGGYAHVRVAPTGESGWVENARLIWRLPAQAAQPHPPGAAQTPAAQTPVVEQPVAAPATPASDSSQPTVAPSIFNPY